MNSQINSIRENISAIPLGEGDDESEIDSLASAHEIHPSSFSDDDSEEDDDDEEDEDDTVYLVNRRGHRGEEGRGENNQAIEDRIKFLEQATLLQTIGSKPSCYCGQESHCAGEKGECRPVTFIKKGDGSKKLYCQTPDGKIYDERGEEVTEDGWVEDLSAEGVGLMEEIINNQDEIGELKKRLDEMSKRLDECGCDYGEPHGKKHGLRPKYPKKDKKHASGPAAMNEHLSYRERIRRIAKKKEEETRKKGMA